MENKVVAIHQPDFIPWLGFYYKAAHCDQFVWLDDAQYSNMAAHNFNFIKTSQGRYTLKVPVEQHLGDPIISVRTRDELGWKKKHLMTLEMNYKRARHFDEFFPMISRVILGDHRNIAELNIEMNSMILEGFGIMRPYVRTSEMNFSFEGREDRIIEICSALGAAEYLSGNGARVYQDGKHFEARGVKLSYLDYKPIEYRQLWPKVGFIDCLSVVDYIFNCGFDWDQVEEKVKELNNGNRQLY